jgi:NAD(P)-dependent dehydrogenase (short-subunit alcohol dehydrogenase family)
MAEPAFSSALPESLRGAALVTGGARRIGRAIALRLADLGFPVAIHFNGSGDAAMELVETIEAKGGRACALHADLARREELDELIGRAVAALGPLTCLVNNASPFEMDRIDTLTRASWESHIEVGLYAPLKLIQDFARLLPATRTGAVVNLLDQRVWNPTPYFVSYTVAKSGLWTLTQTLALALAPRIRVNGIGPGPTLPSPRQSAAQFEAQWSRMPLGRGTTPEEIADTVAFILGASAMTGQMIALDGGQHLGWAQPAQILPEAE